jgi:hypothetical protein
LAYRCIYKPEFFIKTKTAEKVEWKYGFRPFFRIMAVVTLVPAHLAPFPTGTLTKTQIVAVYHVWVKIPYCANKFFFDGKPKLFRNSLFKRNTWKLAGVIPNSYLNILFTHIK